ncbi:large ribosomal subunit protein mL54-like [Ruditapes philippinarum]|uniref:large ribosomal subunit protein mL54-like n=1 Tax=Ruditapes philippinarum TaxID=129788 RepID=UPI00295B282C|nr:large ribosomal subunit protein mL54-like [Ruditapes philippinarum]
MSCNIFCRVLGTNVINNLISHTSRRSLKTQSIRYAAKKGAAPVKKKELEVVTDARILCTRLCGGNINKEGDDPVIGPDEDYPDWLWTLRIDRKTTPLEELSEDDPAYWKKLKIETIRLNNSKFFKK